MRVAAIDIGTNSVLLLIAETRDGGLIPIVERAEITRLGQGVDATRRLAPEAAERTLACLRRYAAEIEAAGAVATDAVGTSALRDAAGGAEFVERAREALGVAPRVISGDEEAELTYRGALLGLALHPARREQPVDGARREQPVDAEHATVFDVGGGSTEVIWPDASGLRQTSLDIGSVRLTERHLRTDPPTQAELDAARTDARNALAGLERPPAGPLVGVAGTVTTLAALLQGVEPYEGARVHGAPMSKGDIGRMVDRLTRLPLADRKGLPGLQPGRADVIIAGAVVVQEVLAWSGADRVVVSDRGVRWGLALRVVSGRDRPTG